MCEGVPGDLPGHAPPPERHGGSWQGQEHRRSAAFSARCCRCAAACGQYFLLPKISTPRALAACAGQPLSDARLQAEIGTFIMGGFETTAHTLAFTLAALAMHPDVQARLAAELDAAGFVGRAERPARQLEYDDLRGLPYLCNVLRESMRMFPVVAGIPRCAAFSTCAVTAP